MAFVKYDESTRAQFQRAASAISSILKYARKIIGSIGRGLGDGGFERGYETAIVTLKEFTTNLPLVAMISQINQLIELNLSTKLAKKLSLWLGL